MPKFTCHSLVAIVMLTMLSPVFTQSGTPWATVINQLLDHPAPPPPMLKEVAEVMDKRFKRSAKEQVQSEQEPGADASATDVIRYWERQVQYETGKQPSEKAREQLLEACLQKEIFSRRLLDLLPDLPATYERIKQFIDHANTGNAQAEVVSEALMNIARREALEGLRNWLMQHSNYFRDELLQRAREVKADGYRLKNEASLTTLARLDWEAARPLVEAYLTQPDAFVQTFALRLLYQHAIKIMETAQAEQLRSRLRELAVNRQISSYAREMAFETLMQHDWPGSREWFAAFFAEENLLNGPKGKDALLDEDTLAAPVKNAPEKWNPLLSQLISSGNQTERNNAVLCLATVAKRKPNREALLPLLPWLTDPKWVTAADEGDRYRVIEAAGKLQLPEAVPGLLAVIQNEKEYARIMAVQALAQYREPQLIARFVPVLRAVIRQGEVNDYSLGGVILLLAKFGGLEDQEKIAGLEALANESDVRIDEWSEDRTPRFGDPKTLSGWIGYALMKPYSFISGWYLDAQSLLSDSLAASVIERIKTLRKEKPEVASKLWMMIRDWEFPTVYLALAERIAAGDADFDTMLVALKRRHQLAASAGAVVQPMLRQSGFAPGIAATLLGDEAEARSILEGNNIQGQIALMACARLVRQSLPIDLVGKLLVSKDKQLALAAERYLESEDSSEARALILSHHPNEALILGAAPDFDPKQKRRDEWIKWENGLRDEVKQGRVDEVFGKYELNWSDTGSSRNSIEIHRQGEQATICLRKDAARQECRVLLTDELSALRALFDEADFDVLPPLSLRGGGGLAGTNLEFVRFDKRGGRRVYASDLYLLSWREDYQLKQRTPHERLDSFLNKLKTTGEYELRYALKEKIKGLEVLMANDKRPVTHVCGQGNEVRALVKDEKAAYDDPPKWRSIKNGKIGEEAAQPAMCPILDTQEDLPESKRQKSGYRPLIWSVRTKDGVIRQMSRDEDSGVWLCRPGSEPQLIYNGYANPMLVTLDGRWLIISKRENEESLLLKIDLKTNAATKIEVEDWVYPVVREPVFGKVIIPISHYDEQNKQRIEGTKLYDPATGKLENITGEVEPLKHQYGRQLQPIAGSSTEFWAAIPDREGKKTKIGRYDARNFKFTPQMELPEIVFSSTEMWVDESAQQLYLAYNGHLLRLPFPTQNTPKR